MGLSLFPKEPGDGGELGQADQQDPLEVDVLKEQVLNAESYFGDDGHVVVVHHEEAAQELGSAEIFLCELVDEIDEIDVVEEGAVVAEAEDLPSKKQDYSAAKKPIAEVSRVHGGKLSKCFGKLFYHWIIRVEKTCSLGHNS